MAFFSNLTTIIILVIVPAYCYYRIQKNKYMALLNPSLHLVVWGYVYLSFPVFFMHDYYLHKIFKFSDQIYSSTNALCNWYVFVFLIYYILSKDQKIESAGYRPKIITYTIATFFVGLTTLIFIFLLFKFGGTLLGMKDRGEALRYFGENIFFNFKYPIFLNIFIASVAVIVWRSRSFYSYLLIPLAISLDLLAKGRMIAWTYLLFAYINYVAISKKTAFKLAIPFFFLLVSTVFFRIEPDDNTKKVKDVLTLLTTIFSDPINNRFTVPLYYKNYVGEGNLGEYMLFSLFQFLPNSITLPLFGYSSIIQTSITYVVDQDYRGKIGYSLSSNIVGEALYYGGIDFAIISPLLIGFLIYSLYTFRVFKTFPGFIFFCFVLSGLRGVMRGTFYNSFLPSIWLMVSYLVWLTVLEWGRVVFISKQISD
jgi:hypothetical protein